MSKAALSQDVGPSQGGFTPVEILRRQSKQVHLQRSARLIDALLDKRAGWRPRKGKATPAVRSVNLRLGAERLAQLVADYESGVTTTQLTVTYRVSKTTVLKALARAGVATRERGMGSERLAECVRLYEQGFTVREIGDLMGVPKSTIRSSFINKGALHKRGCRSGVRIVGVAVPG